MVVKSGEWFKGCKEDMDRQDQECTQCRSQIEAELKEKYLQERLDIDELAKEISKIFPGATVGTIVDIGNAIYKHLQEVLDGK